MKTTKFLPIAFGVVVLGTLMLSIFTRVNAQDPEPVPCTISTTSNKTRPLGVISQKNCPSCEFWYSEETEDQNGNPITRTYYNKKNNYTDITACMASANFDDQCTAVAANPMYQAPSCEPKDEPRDTDDDTGTSGGTNTN